MSDTDNAPRGAYPPEPTYFSGMDEEPSYRGKRLSRLGLSVVTEDVTGKPDPEFWFTACESFDANPDDESTEEVSMDHVEATRLRDALIAALPIDPAAGVKVGEKYRNRFEDVFLVEAIDLDMITLQGSHGQRYYVGARHLLARFTLDPGTAA